MLLDLNFYPWEAEAIKNIHVSNHEVADALIWPRTADGVYSVWSAYCLLAATHHQDQPSSSNVEAGKGLWNGIWKLKVPNKVRHFLWRAVHESLSTKCNLHRRQVLSFGIVMLVVLMVKTGFTLCGSVMR